VRRGAGGRSVGITVRTSPVCGATGQNGDLPKKCHFLSSFNSLLKVAKFLIKHFKRRVICPIIIL